MNFGDLGTPGAIYCPRIQDFEAAAPFAAIENDVGLAGAEVRLAMSAPCAPVVSLNVSTVCQPAAEVSVGRDDLGIVATVGCAVLVGAAVVGVVVGASVATGP